MTYMNMDHELKSLLITYFGRSLKPIITDSVLADLKDLVTAPKKCDTCGAILYWDSRASAYTDEDGRTTTIGISSYGHDHVILNVSYRFGSEVKNE